MRTLTRRNIELKARNPSPTGSVAACRHLGAEDRGEIWQQDTYFPVPAGGLKLRDEHPGYPHLIQFRRPDAPGPRESQYTIARVQDASEMIATLSACLGTGVCVTKRRRLFIWREVRIHLDAVAELGSFIEFEAVAPPSSNLAAEHERVEYLRTVFNITDDLLVGTGYADQLAGRRSLPRQPNVAPR